MPWRITFSLLMVGILIGGGSLVIAAPPQQKPGKPTPLPKAKPSPPPSLPQNPLPSLLQTGPLLPVPLPKPPVPTRSMLYGVNVVWGMNGSDTGWEAGNSAKAKRLVALMKAAGVTNTRVGIGWGDVERERGKLDWRGPDKRLRFIKSQGFVITGVVASIPDWANDPDPAVRALFADRGRADNYAAMAPSPRFYADFGRFAFQLGKRYKEIVHRWEFWNEPDGWGMPSVVRDPSGRPIDIASGGDPALYVRLLKIFSENIKRADPTCLVAVGGLSVPRTDFLQALYANGGQKAFDAVGLHLSSGPRPLAFDWIDACRQVLVAHGDGRKKLWLTEWGWNTYPGEPGGIVEGQQAKLVRASFAGMRERNFIDQASLHTLNDWRAQEDDPLSLRSTGLCARDLTPKPAYYAFQSEARGLNPLPAAKPRRVPLVANWEDTADAPAHLDVYTSQVRGALPKIGRGIALEDAGAGGLPSDWEGIAARLKPSGATLVCLAPFQAAGMVALAADGTPSVQWERADAALSAVAQTGAETILELMPPPNMPPS
ncbi:MAG TPA: hypothetical protein VFB21_14280, partial [Chthonomonadaceae bacterium]|nr:hypothetical protein [Chthonomonadaceae bacterium]